MLNSGNRYYFGWYGSSVMGNGFIFLFKGFETGSSIVANIFYIKNNTIVDADLSNFTNKMSNYLSKKYPSKGCYSEIFSGKYVKKTDEMILEGKIYCGDDPRYNPSYLYKAIARMENNKFIVKSITSAKPID